jgi:hypothetical protein
MTSRKWLVPLLLSLPLAALVLFLGGCLPVGLGDPETSKVDPRLVGVWEELKEDGSPKGTVSVLVPFDGRAYLMRTLEIERGETVRVKPGEGSYKAWLTTIEGKTFLTAQPLYLKEGLAGAKVPGFIVARVDLAADGTKLQAFSVNGGFAALEPLKKLQGHLDYEAPAEGEKVLSEADARALLRKVIAENVSNEELYDTSARFVRVTDPAVLKAVFEGVVG